MRILYGVQGTGNGHIARARVMAKAFAERNDVQVDFVFSGRPPHKYFDMDVFGNYRTLTGLTFVTQNGSVSQWQTLKQAKIRQFFNDIKALDLSGYDLVLNDFEPVSAWAAKRQKVPAIAVSHQAAFTHPVPKQGDRFSDRLIMRFFAPTDIQLGVHWYHFGHSIMPPFIEETMDVDPSHKHFLVYLPFEGLEAIKQLLQPFDDFQFECFHPDLTEERVEGHIAWRKTSKPHFQNALKHCAGVIANGGFELSSECLKLGKKLLIKPLKGQYEQASNVLTLEKLGLCTSMSELCEDTVRQWLPSPAPEPVHFPSDPNVFIDWLLSRRWHDTQAICDLLWQQVKFPQDVEKRLYQMQVTPQA